MFPPARDVEEYLQEYAKKNGLLQYIRFQTTVVRAYKDSAEHDGKQPRWVVESRKNGKEVLVENYDYVGICNGHYEKASIPVVPGLQWVIVPSFSFSDNGRLTFLA